MICLIKFLDKSKLLFKLTICPHYVAPAILYKTKISIIQNNLLAKILMFLCILCSVLKISFSFLRRIVVHNINDTGSFKTSLKKFELPVNKYEINLGHFKNNHGFKMVLLNFIIDFRLRHSLQSTSILKINNII